MVIGFAVICLLYSNDWRSYSKTQPVYRQLIGVWQQEQANKRITACERSEAAYPT